MLNDFLSNNYNIDTNSIIFDSAPVIMCYINPILQNPYPSQAQQQQDSIFNDLFYNMALSDSINNIINTNVDLKNLLSLPTNTDTNITKLTTINKLSTILNNFYSTNQTTDFNSLIDNNSLSTVLNNLHTTSQTTDFNSLIDNNSLSAVLNNLHTTSQTTDFNSSLGTLLPSANNNSYLNKFYDTYYNFINTESINNTNSIINDLNTIHSTLHNTSEDLLFSNKFEDIYNFKIAEQKNSIYIPPIYDEQSNLALSEPYNVNSAENINEALSKTNNYSASSLFNTIQNSLLTNDSTTNNINQNFNVTLDDYGEKLDINNIASYVEKTIATKLKEEILLSSSNLHI